MLSYVLIGLGGAIGSVGRAWLGTAIAALTGLGFPWGTILINILGSFVIGFFGTLTAADGRFAASFDTRAFVMVGICGGFTTFSSFSLQTLDLLRDGRAGQALGNIALSVLLCLASVAAGYSLAFAVRTSRLAMIGEAAPGTFGASTLVALHRPEAVRGMLDTARQLMNREDGRITVLAIDGPVMAGFQPTEEVLTAERRAEMASRRSDWVKGMRVGLDDWVSQERRAGHPARWVEVGGEGARAVAEHGRRAHLLLLEQNPGDPNARARVHAALAGSGQPVLLVPAGHRRPFGRVVAVAWRDEANTGRAVRTAMPLLSRADRVAVLRVGPADALPDLFQGMPVEQVVAPAKGDDVGAQLLEMARDADADLLVMGSGGRRGRRELQLGGVTGSVVARADLPVLLQHRDA